MHCADAFATICAETASTFTSSRIVVVHLRSTDMFINQPWDSLRRCLVAKSSNHVKPRKTERYTLDMVRYPPTMIPFYGRFEKGYCHTAAPMSLSASERAPPLEGRILPSSLLQR